MSAAVVVPVRQRGGTVGEASRNVHLAAWSDADRPGAISTLCGALFAVEQVEMVDLGMGMPCSTCLVLRSASEQPASPATGLVPGGPAPLHRRATPSGYAALGWPVLTRGDQVLLPVDGRVAALLLPAALARQVQDVLCTRARAVPVLQHPHAPDHRFLLAGEPFGVPLPWPATVRVATGPVPLPPTVTPMGPVRWEHLPDGHPLGFCREIDIFAALRTLGAGGSRGTA